MTKKQALNYLKSSGMSKEQIQTIVETLGGLEIPTGSTTKNDLGVDVPENNVGNMDCISRQAVLDITWQDPSYTDPLNVLTEVRDKVRELPSVTPIRAKGHWIKIGDRGFGYSDIVICKCSECEEQEEFTGKFDGHNLVIDTERADNYCSNCGADMREVVEE